MSEKSQQLGKYEILEEIGRGGFATVYRARDMDLGREIALKILDPLLMRDETFAKRFKREARSAAILQHPNLVTIFDLGEDRGRLYIAAEYLTGGDLKQRLAKGPLPLTEAAAVVSQIGAALDYAHKKGMIHRDVKPANILFDELERAKLSDFGIVKAASGTQFTTMGVTLGTPEYMAPEQAEGKDLDGRTDLYALGIVAYEMATNRVPFTGETPSTIHYKHVHEPPPPPDQIKPTVPAELSAVLLKALSKNPNDRYATCADFAAALHAAAKEGERAYWEQSLCKVKDLLTQEKLDLAEKQIETLACQRPGDPALAQLQTRLQEEHTLAKTYTEANEHLQIATDKARQVLALRADYPDRERVFETLRLRRGRRRQRRPETRQETPKTTTVPAVKSPSRAIRKTAWWMLGSSVLLVPCGIGIIGIVGAIGLLKRRSWGRKVGLAFSILLELAGLVAAMGIVFALTNGGIRDDEVFSYWAISAAALIGMSIGIILAYRLGKESVAHKLGGRLKRPACAWPIAIPMMLTGLGIIPAVGLLRNKNWGRVAMMTFLCLFALGSITGAIVAGSDMRVRYWSSFFENYHYFDNEWGVAIAAVEAAAITIWCAIAFFHLNSRRVKEWFKRDARTLTEGTMP